MEKALEIVNEQGTASASMLQRRLRIGYNRAARLIEQMEDEGSSVLPMGSKGDRSSERTINDKPSATAFSRSGTDRAAAGQASMKARAERSGDVG